jgi:hypothetical protein
MVKLFANMLMVKAMKENLKMEKSTLKVFMLLLKVQK